MHHPQRPFVLLAQQSLHDPSRVTHGRQVVWAYCHAPHASTESLSGPIDRQIERFAPASHRILVRVDISPAQLERRNPNYVGGDIFGGSMAGLQ